MGTDPVITGDGYAYSTIITQEITNSQGNTTGNGALYIYEIDEAKNLSEISLYPNIGYVQGLSLWEKNLLICAPMDGILQMDVSDPVLVEQVRQIDFVLCEDILHLGNGHFVTVGRVVFFN